MLGLAKKKVIDYVNRKRWKISGESSEQHRTKAVVVSATV
jgi:hypothetical protein